MVLLSKRQNPSARNFDFDVKKKKYFTSRSGTSPFALTTQVLAEDVWTPDVVERRQKDLVAKLSTPWRLE